MALLNRTLSRSVSSFRPRLEALEDRHLLSGGVLDPTFGSGGRVTTDLGGTEAVHAMALQTDGKIVEVGQTNAGSDLDFALVRYNTNGSVDTSFGTGGNVKTDINGHGNDFARAVAIQADGKIVVAGYTVGSHGSGDFAVVRYNANGSIDTTFGGSKAKGKVVVDLGGWDKGWALAIQTDGKIVVAGLGGSPGGFAMIRLTTAGALDTSFDGDGKVVTLFPNGSPNGAWAMTLQSDGKIVLTGEGDQNSLYLGVARYNVNGSLDPTFGTGGKAVYTTLSADFWDSVKVQSDGKIVVTTAVWGPDTPAIARLNPNGSLDATFGTNGVAVIAGLDNESVFESLVIQADGKFVLAGSSYDSNTGNTSAIMARVNSDGTTDSTFGTGGIVTTTFGGSTVPNWAVVLIGSDGNLYLGGGVNGDFALERYLA